MNPLKKATLPTLIMFISGSGAWLKRISGKYAIRRQVRPFPDLIWRRHFQPANPYCFPHHPGPSKLEHYHHWYIRSAGSQPGNQTPGSQLRIWLQVVKQKPGPGGVNSKLSWPDNLWIPTMGNNKPLIIFSRSIQPSQALFSPGLAKPVDTQEFDYRQIPPALLPEIISLAGPPVGRGRMVGGPDREQFNRPNDNLPELVIFKALRPILTTRESMENSGKPLSFSGKTPAGIQQLPDSPAEFSLRKQNAEIEKIVDRVYRMLEKQLIIEKNRRGIHTAI